MESLYKTAVTFTFLTLFLLLTAATSTSAASTAPENCSEKCGNMSISYPFGIKNGCFRDGFQISCDEATGIAILGKNMEIIDISLSNAQMRINNWISYSCNYANGTKITFTSFLVLGSSSSTYRISHKHNKFTAVGCQTLAYISGPFISTGGHDYSPFATGCLSLCTNQSKFLNNSAYSGIGCCEAAIPEGLESYNITFDPGFVNAAIWDYSPCSFAFLVEEGFYSFQQSDTEIINLLDRLNKRAPVVLDWVLGTESLLVMMHARTYLITLKIVCAL